MIKGYIFDMDGTLLDSLDAWHNIGNRYLETLGVQGDPDLDRIMAHMALNDGAQYINERFQLHKTKEEIIEGVKKIINHKYEYEIQLKVGVKDFLQKCQNQGYKMCVLTASDSVLAKKAFQRLGILQYFQEVYACHEISLTKQNPQSYIEVAKKMNLKPQECVIVEDALYALSTAKKAGFYTKAIYDEENQKDWLEIKKIADEAYQSFDDMKI